MLQQCRSEILAIRGQDNVSADYIQGNLAISSLQCYSVLSTIAQVLRKMSILIFDALFITDLLIIPES